MENNKNKKYEFLLIKQAGYVWRLPAHIIAHDRASYYVEGYLDATYEEEYEYTIGDASELHDWFVNNMDIDDFLDSLELVESPKPLKYPNARQDLGTMLLLEGEEYDTSNWD